MAVRFAIRRDNTTNWATGNPVLASGEPAFDTQLNTLRIGDGKTHYNDLPDFTGTILPGSIELGASATALQYRIGGGAWTDLIPISDLAGPPGIGTTGPPAALSIGTVSTGAAGSAAAATVTGTAPNYTLNLTLPAGAAGAAGVVDYMTVYNAFGFIQIKVSGGVFPDRSTTLIARGITPASFTGYVEWYSVGTAGVAAPGSAVIGDVWWQDSP